MKGDQSFVQALWNDYCEENRLKVLLSHEEEEIAFQQHAKLTFNGLDNILIEYKERHVFIQFYQFVHNFPLKPVNVYSFLDDFFLHQFQHNPKMMQILNDEEQLLVKETIEWLSKFRIKDEVTPFFHSLRKAETGLQLGKKDFNSGKGRSYEDFLKFAMHKSLMTSLNVNAY